MNPKSEKLTMDCNKRLPFKYLSLTVILASCLVFNSCGRQKRDKKDEALTGETLNVAAELSDVEKEVALRVCTAYRSKRTRFNVGIIQTPNFSKTFFIENKNCDGGSIPSRQADLLVESGPNSTLFYRNNNLTNSNVPFLSEVHTDLDGPIADVCAKRLQNISDIMNQTVLANGEVEQVEFGSKSSSLDVFVIKRARYEERLVNQDGQNTTVRVLAVYKANSYTVVTDSFDDHYGVNSTSVHEEMCSTDGEISKLTQTLVR
jgi:hypothetical protein